MAQAKCISQVKVALPPTIGRPPMAASIFPHYKSYAAAVKTFAQTMDS